MYQILEAKTNHTKKTAKTSPLFCKTPIELTSKKITKFQITLIKPKTIMIKVNKNEFYTPNNNYIHLILLLQKTTAVKV